MTSLYYLLTALWFFRTIKYVLFYLYLWQLKEYHFKRLIDHFRTDNGKRLFLNYSFFSKALLVILFLISKNILFLYVITAVIFLLYFIESIVFIINIFRKSFKKPVFTKKALFLSFLSFLVLSIFFSIIVLSQKDIFQFALWLLVIDILIPFAVSLVILLIQPFVVLYRNEFVLKKAKEKISKRKDLIVVGITGSFGKTSVKEFLSAILLDKFNVLKTDKHQNSEMGISKCILEKLKPEHQVFVVEMGAYGKGGIKLLADIAKPKIGILTGINEQHLSLFGSLANIISAKYELIQSLPKDGLAIFNGDNNHCQNLFKQTEMPKKIYNINKTAKELSLNPDIWAEDVKAGKDSISFKVFTKRGESSVIKVDVLGKQNVSNILAAVLAANEMGMSLEEISKACSKITKDQGSITYHIGKRGENVLNASYSSNPDGVLADLEYLKIWPGKKILVMPCLIELGSAALEAHRRIGEKIGEACDLAVITTGEWFDILKKEAMLKGMKPENIVLLEKPEEALIQLDIFTGQGDTILLEGRVSKKIINSLYEL